jgi:hypothetical protein
VRKFYSQRIDCLIEVVDCVFVPAWYRADASVCVDVLALPRDAKGERGDTNTTSLLLKSLVFVLTPQEVLYTVNRDSPEEKIANFYVKMQGLIEVLRRQVCNDSSHA